MQISMFQKITSTVIHIVLVLSCFWFLLKMGIQPLPAAILMLVIKGVLHLLCRLSCLMVSLAFVASFIYLLIHI